MTDDSFDFNDKGLKTAVDLLGEFLNKPERQPFNLPVSLPEKGEGEFATLRHLASLVVGQAAPLGDKSSFAHMDPPTPWITWATTMWNASLNQNLLHPATSPSAKHIEETVINWLSPFFGMSGGQMVPGSTLANLTALWAARELCGAKRVVASAQSHISIRKAAHILGLQCASVDTDAKHRLNFDRLDDLTNTILVLTAGTTSTGAIDSLTSDTNAPWIHVDAAWAGPMMLSEVHKIKLGGIDSADSIAISAHKWFFQPKESALILFKDWKNVLPNISFGGAYLSAPNVGILGSHGAMAVPLLATLMALGKRGVAERIDICMQNAEVLTEYIKNDNRFMLFAEPESGVVVWKPKNNTVDDKIAELTGIVSTTKIDNQTWLRSVAANPNSNVDMVFKRVCSVLY